MIYPEDRFTRLMVLAGVECLSTRAKSMLLGPKMRWSDKRFNFSFYPWQFAYLLAICLQTSFRLRKILSKFGNTSAMKTFSRVISPIPPIDSGPESVLEEVAWQYYLDHRQVFLNYRLGPLIKIINKLLPFLGIPPQFVATRTASLALSRLTQLVRQAGAATIQADICLFRTRYGIGDDLEFSEHFWTLINNPVGRAMVARDRGDQLLKAGRKEDAEEKFKECYLLSTRCGSHLTALKALIGLFHVRYPFREVRWRKHIECLEGNVHVNFFRSRTPCIDKSGSFKSLRKRRSAQSPTV